MLNRLRSHLPSPLALGLSVIINVALFGPFAVFGAETTPTQARPTAADAEQARIAHVFATRFLAGDDEVTAMRSGTTETVIATIPAAPQVAATAPAN